MLYRKALGAAMLAPLALALVALTSPVLQASAQEAGQELVISTSSGEHTLQVELAAEPAARTRGLMFRREMAEDHGMLFDFGTAQPVSMWMENTYIPLDMLFIESDGTIESIAERTTPLSRRSIASEGPVRYVLEINGGLSDKLGVRPGDKVSSPAIEAAR